MVRRARGAAGAGAIRNGRAKQHIPVQNWKIAGKGGAEGVRSLVAETSADGNAFTANGTAAAEHGSACFGFHARPKSVNFYTAVAVGLKCALGHGNALLFALKNLRFDSEVKYSKMWARNPAELASKRRGDDSEALQGEVHLNLEKVNECENGNQKIVRLRIKFGAQKMQFRNFQK
jgi:hypothetical protein